MKHGLVMILGLLSLFVSVKSAWTKDHELLERNMPTELEDAYVADYRALEVFFPARWERLAEGDDQVSLLPRFEGGVFPNAEISLEVPVFMGEAGTTESGDLEIEGTYNFNVDGIYLPATSIVGSVRAPSGKDSEITEPGLALLLAVASAPPADYHDY